MSQASPTWCDLIRQALLISNLAPRGQSADPQLNEDALSALRFMLSDWSRDGILEPAYTQTIHTLTGGIQQYTAGPGGVFDKRPLFIQQCILSGASLGQVFYPIRVSPWDEFLALTFPSAQGLPSDMYYNPTYPLGTVAFYPTPNEDWTVQIVGLFAWDTVDGNDTVSLPPGYDSAIVDNLAVRIAQNYNYPVPAYLANRAQRAMNGILMALPDKDKSRDNMILQQWRPVRNWQTDSPR